MKIENEMRKKFKELDDKCQKLKCEAIFAREELD